MDPRVISHSNVSRPVVFHFASVPPRLSSPLLASPREAGRRDETTGRVISFARPNGEKKGKGNKGGQKRMEVERRAAVRRGMKRGKGERKDKKDLAPRDTVLANVPRRSLYRRPIVIHD